MFTWSGGFNNRLKSRIDWFLISEDWEVHFQGAIQFVLARPVSDHFIILLDGGGMRKGSMPFRFENMWLKEEGFKEVLRKWWKGIRVTVSANFFLIEKLKVLKPIMKRWNKRFLVRLNLRSRLLGIWWIFRTRKRVFTHCRWKKRKLGRTQETLIKSGSF